MSTATLPKEFSTTDSISMSMSQLRGKNFANTYVLRIKPQMVAECKNVTFNVENNGLSMLKITVHPPPPVINAMLLGLKVPIVSSFC